MINKIVVGALCALLGSGCSGEKKQETKQSAKREQQIFVPPPPSAPTNPFEHPAPTPISHSFQQPIMKPVGEFKINEGANMVFWRDEANGVVCYCIDFADRSHTMSCVQEQL
jgi:hypothetical protein